MSDLVSGNRPQFLLRQQLSDSLGEDNMGIAGGEPDRARVRSVLGRHPYARRWEVGGMSRFAAVLDESAVTARLHLHQPEDLAADVCLFLCRR